MVASSGFVGLAALAWADRGGRFGAMMFLGLIACWWGDYLGTVRFEYGALCFLLAHLIFLGGFVSRGLERSRIGILVLSVSLAAMAMITWLWPHVPPGQRLLVASYLLVISSMVVGAGATADPRWPFLFAAAAIFYVSDIAVAGWKYVNPDGRWGLLCYPLYYASCLMLAASPLVLGRRGRTGGVTTGDRTWEEAERC
jgi:uncharacterized membrane protein YhhN